MTIEVTSWDEIPQTEYDAAYALVSQVVVGRYPELHVRRGTISDLLLVQHGVLGAAGRVERDRLVRSNSLLEIAADPALADAETADRLFSNYRIVRRAGTFARGSVTIVLSRAAPITIPSGFVFETGGRQFTTETSFSARLSNSDVLSATDRVLAEQADGTFTFSIDVVSSSLGVVGMLRQGDVVTPEKPLPFVTRCMAARDFVDGRDAESTAAMYARLEAGVAARTWSNATNIEALVREQTGFSDVFVSSCGAGAPEMLRDKHSLFPIAYGNRLDIWVKPPRYPVVTTTTLSAVYTGSDVTGDQWAITLGRDDIPAHYMIVTLLRKGRAASGAVAPATVTRTYSAQAGDPDIANALEAGFSRYQSSVITFTDTRNTDDTLVADETEVEYQVTALLMEGLSTLQSTLTAPALAPPAGDLVVRGAVPCLVSLELELDTIPDDLPQADIRAAVAEYVNGTAFVGALYASRITTIVAPFLPSTVNVNRVRISGIIVGPDGTRQLYRARDVLSVPDMPEKMITANTVGFFLDPQDVAINLGS